MISDQFDPAMLQARDADLGLDTAAKAASRAL